MCGPTGSPLEKLPGRSSSVSGHASLATALYVTFQDDWVAFKVADLMNWRRLLWANDFPHSESTWPWSQQMLAEHTGALTPEQKRGILCDNVAALYQIDTSTLAIA